MSTESVPELLVEESPSDELIDKDDLQLDQTTQSLRSLTSQMDSQKLNSAFETIWNLSKSGFNYHVVSVFGSQSTGKSTLLNRLFGTRFAVMNESVRSQTTKGIWMSKGQDSNILVLDVEGTDGQERGEDQDFERKSALFSLAISEVLIVNLWESSVGLYNGANMGLLKVVLEVNLQLFQRQGSPKTCLFFIIRDFTCVTALDALGKTLTENLERIWQSITKPEGREYASLTDFFDLRFYALAHKVYAPDRFEEGAAIVKQKFYNEDDTQEYLFQSNYHRGIPADGFSKFSNDIWETIVSNRDLDLPSQQELLAQYRCDEISKVAFGTFQQQVKPLKSSLDSGTPVSSFGKSASGIIDSLLEKFDTEAGRYTKHVYERVRQDLIARFHATLYILFSQILRSLHKACVIFFESRFSQLAEKDENQFAENLRTARLESVGKFMKCVEESTVSGAEWSHDEALKEFLDQIEKMSQRKKEEAFARLKFQLEKQVKNNLSEPLALLFADLPSDLWDQASSALSETLSLASTTLQTRLSGLEANDTEIAEAQKQLKVDTWNTFLSLCETEVSESGALDKVKKRFESAFKYDNGIPRVWRVNDDVDSVFSKAKEQAEKLLALLAHITIPLEKLDSSLTSHPEFDSGSMRILPPLKCKHILDRFHREADVMFLEAKRSTVATTMNIPTWFLGLTLLLGWNEIMTVLRNPLLTMMFAIVAGGVYLIYWTNLGGPMVQVARVTLGEVGRQAGEKLRDVGIEPEWLFSVEGVQRGIHQVSTVIQNATAPPPGTGVNGTMTSSGNGTKVSRGEKSHALADVNQGKDKSAKSEEIELTNRSKKTIAPEAS